MGSNPSMAYNLSITLGMQRTIQRQLSCQQSLYTRIHTRKFTNVCSQFEVSCIPFLKGCTAGRKTLFSTEHIYLSKVESWEGGVYSLQNLPLPMHVIDLVMFRNPTLRHQATRHHDLADGHRQGLNQTKPTPA